MSSARRFAPGQYWWAIDSSGWHENEGTRWLFRISEQAVVDSREFWLGLKCNYETGEVMVGTGSVFWFDAQGKLHDPDGVYDPPFLFSRRARKFELCRE